jgi:DNA-binding CsgD family transcriptional regulator
MAGCLMILGLAVQRRGEPERAKALLKQSLAMDGEMGYKADIAENLEGLAEAAGAQGEDVRAARLWGAAGALREAIGRPWWSTERLLHEPQLVAARSRMDEATWDTAFAEGKAMGLERAVEYALSEEPTASSVTPQSERSLGAAWPATLTRREGEVAAMVARGLSNRQIASDLFLSERTIENHISKILRKLELASRAQVSAWATEQRLFTSDSG